MKFHHHPHNPIFPLVADSWRCDVSANADVLLYEGEWRLYLRGNGRDGDGRRNSSIGLFTCPQEAFDGETWQEYAGNPVFTQGEPGSIDDFGPLDPSMLVVDGQVLMFYTAVPRGNPLNERSSSGRGSSWGHAMKSIGLAVSDDGLRFQRRGDEPLVPHFAAAPEVLSWNDEYWMFYSALNEIGGTDIHLIRSTDPFRFDAGDAIGKIFSPGPAGSWDGICVTTLRIFRDGGIWYMVYAGSNVHEDTPWYFGVAASRDLIHWTRYPGNPVFERGAEGQWDDCGIWYGTTVKVGDTYYMWYEGRSCGEPRHVADQRPGGRGRGGKSQVGLATMRSETFFFTI